MVQEYNEKVCFLCTHHPSFNGAMAGGSSLWCLKWSSISQCTIGWNPPPPPYDSGLCVNPKKTDWHSLRISQFLFPHPLVSLELILCLDHSRDCLTYKKQDPLWCNWKLFVSKIIIITYPQKIISVRLV